MDELSKKEDGQIIQKQVEMMTSFLERMGLPADNIIANETERAKIGQNLPQFIYDLDPKLKQDARYLSKFVVGAAFGLFDYALNAIWNEVVLALNKKAVTYGLDIFFDNAVGTAVRASYKKEEDLSGLKDIVLLDTCRKLELISDTTYKKLAHILDMRNDIGISHPTGYSINAYELLGWLENCIQDVLNDAPSASAIQVKSFIDNLKNEKVLLEEERLKSIKPKIEELATHHCDSILRTIFGIYVADDTDQIVRKNISLISKIVWPCSSDDEKYRIGITLEGYNNNLKRNKHVLGEEFLTHVSGNRYRTTSERVAKLDRLADELIDAHSSRDNFYKEVPIMEGISTFIEKSTDIPVEVASKLIRAVLHCRIGNGTWYQGGVSSDGKPLYNRFFEILGEEHIPRLIVELSSFKIQRKLGSDVVRHHCIDLLRLIRKSLINDKFIESIDYLIEKFDLTGKTIFDTEFKKITGSILDWQEDGYPKIKSSGD